MTMAVTALSQYIPLKFIPILIGVLIYIYRRIFHPSARGVKPTRAPVSAARTSPRGTGVDWTCVSPGTGKVLGIRKEYSPDDVKRVEREAREAQREWSQSTFLERRAVLQAISDWILANPETISTWSVQDNGKTVSEANLTEIMTSLEKLRWIIAHGAKHLQRESRPVASLLAFGKKAYVEFAPLGVIGIIVPWNHPFHNILSAVAAAIFAGNGVVCKSSEYASWSAEPIEMVFRTILAARGWNPNLVQIITGQGATGGALTTSGVDKMLFIGSPQVGTLVMRAAAERLTPVILELGGKDPFIVFEDADFDHMMEIAIRSAFLNCGQNCVSAERFYIHESLYDRFVAEAGRRASALRVGYTCPPGDRKDGTIVRDCDVGAMTMKPQVAHVQRLVDDAIATGARLVCGGKQKIDPEFPEGLYFEPTVLADVTHNIRIANEEVFGPVMTIMKFKTEEEVIRLANCTEYGLSSSVFTRDLARGQRVASQMHSGMCSINDWGINHTIQSLPFGGVKRSGFGAFNGKEGLRGFSLQRAVVCDRFPVRLWAPSFLWFPIHPRSDKITQAGLHMVYGDSWIGSARALVRMMKLILAPRPKPVDAPTKKAQ